MIDGGAFLGTDPVTGRTLPGSVVATPAPGAPDATVLLAMRAVHSDGAHGNDEVLSLARGSPAIIPVAGLNCRGFDARDGVMAKLGQQGAEGIALWPAPQGWTFSAPAARSLLEQAGRQGLPVQCLLESPDELAGLAALLDRLSLPVPVMIRWMGGSAYNAVADLVAMADSFPGLFIDTGSLTQAGIIRWLASRIGARRLFLASNRPVSWENTSLSLLAAAELAKADEREITGGTLARIFGRPAPAGEFHPPPEVRDLLAWPKIDTHWHTGSWMLVEPERHSGDLVRMLDRFNCQYVLSSSIHALTMDINAGNAETAAFCDLDPRIRGMIVVNPRQTEDSLAAIEHYGRDRRFVGVKTIQDFHDIGLDAPAYAPLIRRAGALSLPVMAHLPGMAGAAAAHPDCTFIAAHGVWRWQELLPFPNVIIDIATSTPLRRDVDLGAMLAAMRGRIVFSSDAPLMSPAFPVGKLAGLLSGPDETDDILRRTALRVFPRLGPVLR